MNWRPLGLIYKTDSWAQCPTPLVMQDRVRVYFASRHNGRSFIRFVDLALDDPTFILDDDHEQAVLFNGKPGTFDHCGQIPSCAVFGCEPHDVMLWYSGWTAPSGDTPYHNAAGVVYSEDGGRTFRRDYDGPRLDRTEEEPYLRVTPCEVDGWTWYVSGLRWERINDRYEPIYVIRHLAKHKDNPIAIPQEHELECFSRPWVVKDADVWRMFYCYRDARDYRDGKNAYRIGYASASSVDGPWHRQDDIINLPRSDWDSTMQAYPATFDVKGKRYLLWNGNHFGKHGFGLAVAE